jgi:hypothetical protein
MTGIIDAIGATSADMAPYLATGGGINKTASIGASISTTARRPPTPMLPTPVHPSSPPCRNSSG